MKKEKLNVSKVEMRKFLSDIFRNGHAIAKGLQFGSYKARLALGLKQAWDEFKAGLKKAAEKILRELPKLIGSPKQVEWAENIRSVAIEAMDNAWQAAEKLESKALEMNRRSFNRHLDDLLNAEYATYFINGLKAITYKETLYEKIEVLKKHFRNHRLFTFLYNNVLNYECRFGITLN
jgi:hypothetical protein